MAKVEIIAKLKQKNDADFKIADAKDIEMEDGSDLQSTIDNIKKNGTNIDTEKYATKEELETKADKEHTHDYNDITNAPEIPSIEGLATEDYVDTAIANAQLSGGEIDTSNFATKEDLNAKVDKKLGYSLVSDSEINRLSSIDNYDDTEIKNELNNKSDLGHTHSYKELSDKPTIPSIEGLATEDYVKNEIANAQLSSGEVDLSGYATKEELSVKADKIHTHTIADVDNLQTTLNNKSDLGHTHNYNDIINTPEIPSVEGLATKGELNNKVDKLEGHSLISDSEIIRLSKVDNYDDTELRNKLNNKSDKGHRHDYSEITNPPVIPSIEGLATEDYVKNEIANAQLSQGEVDLSGYATKNDLDTKVDKINGYSLVSDIEITRLSGLHNYDDTEIRNKLNNKSDKGHRHDYSEISNTPTIPSIEGLATEIYVDTKIAEAQLSGGEIDLSGYATKDELNNKADKSELHEHSNKNILDGITQDKISSWDNKSDFSGKYEDLENPPTIPIVDVNKNYVDTQLNKKVDKKNGYSLISNTEIQRLANVDNYDDSEIKNTLESKADKTELHSHSNKTVLDGITSAKIQEWNNKSDFSGDYNDLSNPPTIPTVDVNKNYVDTQLNKKVDKKNGYSLISNTEIQRLANVDNYDDSEIRSMLNSKANKTELHSHSNKTVLDGITSTKIQEWDNKSDFSGKYEDLENPPTIPSLDGYATQTYVKNEIANAQLGSGQEVDLSGYATKDDLNNKADKTELHSHNNKEVLDSITRAKINSWDNKSEFSGDYNDLSNPPTIPVVDSVLSSTSTNTIQNKVVKSALDGKANSSHSHIISDVTNLQTSLDGKSNVGHTHSYNDLSDTPRIPTVTNDLTNVLKSNYDTAYIHSQSPHAPSNAEQNVQSDWNVTDTTSDAFIKNKPSIHNHGNKKVLDGITADKVNEWNNKSDFSGDYNDLSNPPTIPIVDSALSTTSINAIQNKVVTNALNNKANSSHNHTIDNIANLQSTLNNKSDKGHRHDYSELGNTPTIDTALSTTSTNSVQNKVITTALNKKANTSHTHNYSELTNPPTIPTKTSQITNDSGFITNTQLNTELDKKANTSHNHAIADITNLQSTLDGKASSSHRHSYNDLLDTPTIPIVDSTLSTTSTNAIQNKVVTSALNKKANSSHTHSINDITNLQNSLNSKSDKGHRHDYSELENAPTIPTVDVNKSYVDTQLNKKVDKKNGYSLIADTEIKRLANVDNYDDTEIRSTLNSKANKTDLHSHSNKTVLDGITSTKIQEWDNKSNFSGKYEDLENPPTIPTVDSALSTTSTNAIQNKVVTNALNNKANSSHTHNYAGSSSSGGSASSAIKLATSRKISLNGDASGSANFDGTSDITINTSVRKYCMVGSDVENSNGWYKVASETMSGYGDTNITFIVTSTYGNYHSGILQLQIRSDNTNISCKTLVWFNRHGFSTDNFIVNINNMTWTLYTNQTIPRYGRLMFEVISESSITTKTTGITLFNSSTKESTTPVATVKSKDGGKVDNALTANKLATSRTLTIGKTGKTFDGSANVSWSLDEIGASASSHTHTISNVTNLQTALDGKSNTGHTHDYSELNNPPTIPVVDSALSSTSTNAIQNKVVTNALNGKANSSHTHSYKDLSDKPTIPTMPTIDSALSSTSTNPVQNKVVKTALDGKANSSHTHSISNITNLQTTLDGKSNTNHTHSYKDLSDKPTIPVVDSTLSSTSTNPVQNKVVTNALNGKANSSHTHSYKELSDKPTIPVVDNALSSTSTNAIQNKVVKNALDGKSNTGHTHDYTKLNNLPTIPTVTNDLTNELKANYDTAYTHSQSAHAPSNAEQNVQSDWNVTDTTSDAYIKNKPTIPVVDSALSSTSTNAIQNKVVKSALDGKSNTNHTHSYKELSDKPTIPVVDNALSSTSTNAIQNKVVKSALDGKANSSHTHSISNITNLQTTLDGKSNTNHTHNYAGSSSAGGDATNALACSGNAATATKLQTARTINGTSFNGSANITTNKWGTARNITIGNTTKTIDGSGNISWTLREIGIYDSVVKIVTNTQELKSALLQGGAIYVLGGTYPLAQNEVLEYVSNTHLIAIGDVTISVNPTSSTYIAMRPHLNGTEGGYTGVTNFNMSGITFDGNGATNACGLFATAHGRNIHIEGCTFKNINNSWHLVEINSSDTVVFDRCTISDYNYREIKEGDYFTEAFQLDYAGEGGLYPFTCLLDNTGCQNITFNNCTFTRVKTTWTACIGSHSYLKNSMPKNVTVNGCSFDDIDNCIYGLDYKNLSVINCTFYNVATAIIIDSREDNNGTSITAIGNRYNGKQRYKYISQFNGTNEGRFIMHHNYHNRLSSSNISNNFIEWAYSHGIGITPVDTTIIGNSVRYCGKHGIYLYGGQQTSIIGNTSVYNGQLEWYTGYDIYVIEGAIKRVWRCNISNNASYVTVNTTGNFNDVIVTNNLNTKG